MALRSLGKTTKVGWRWRGAAELHPKARSAKTRGCQGLMVRMPVSG